MRSRVAKGRTRTYGRHRQDEQHAHRWIRRKRTASVASDVCFCKERAQKNGAYPLMERTFSEDEVWEESSEVLLLEWYVCLLHTS